MSYNLTKKEMRTIITEDLNVRYCRILERADLLDAEEIPIKDAREILYIEDILRERLVKFFGHDFYPPDRIEKQAPSNYMISLLKTRQNKPEKKAEPTAKTVNYEKKTEGKFTFKITIISSIGSIVARQNIKADSKSDAAIEAQKMIEKLGQKKATYKIS